MYRMKEMEMHMKGCLRKNREGFISSYFFVIFLFVITFAAAALQSESDSLKTMINLKKEAEYFAQEAEIISSLKCSLNNMDPADAGGILTVEAESLPETITVYYDPQTKRIIDFSCSRRTDGLSVPEP